MSGWATGALSATTTLEHIRSILIIILHHLVVVLASGAVVVEAARRCLVLDLLLAWAKRRMLLDCLHVGGHACVATRLQHRYHGLQRTQLIVCKLGLVVIKRGIVESSLLTHSLLILQLPATAHVGDIFTQL